MNEFYVYIYIDPRKLSYQKDGYEFSGEPFYVGKGKGTRKYAHLYCKSNNKFLVNKIKKIIREGCFPQIIIYKDILTEDEAFFYEKNLIKSLGRRNLKLGPLCNLTDGGEGISGKIWSNEEKIHMSEIMKSSKNWKTFYLSDLYKENMNKVSRLAKMLKNIPYESRYGIERSIEIRSLISKNHANIVGKNNPMYGRHHSLSTKNKISSKVRGNDKCGGRLGKVFAQYKFYKDGELVKEIYGQKNAKIFCKENKIPFQTLCKGISKWENWSCNRNRKN